MNELLQLLAEKGFKITPDFNNVFHRFDRGGTLNAWYKGKTVPMGEKTLLVALFGDWRTDESYSWQSEDLTTLPETERVHYEGILKEAQNQEAHEKQARQEQASQNCGLIWETECFERGAPPYTVKKGLDQLYGARTLATESGLALVVPAKDTAGKLWGLQKIFPDGTKSFYPGMRIKSCFHTLGTIEPSGMVFVAEGFSTAASIHMATRVATVSSFNAGNLESVCAALRSHFGESLRIVVAGDDDRHTVRPDGTAYNPGREKALRAARSVGAQALFPRFRDPLSRHTDWNDLHGLEGLDVVKEQLESGASDTKETESMWQINSNKIAPLPPSISKMGIPQAPRQQKVVEHILNHLQGALIKQDRELFRYVGTHWKILTMGEQDQLKVLIQYVCSGLGDVKHLDATFKLLIYHMPSPPDGVDMFVPHPFCVNFLNGTLHLSKKNQKYSSEFRPHNPKDFLVHVLPYQYAPDDKVTNPEFLGMIDRVFQGDSDAEEKKRAVRQMYGACLLPAFPRLFMLYGPPGTGKSTVLNVAARLVHKDNLCSVPPSQWHGFNMEGMACKLVNIDTDIPLNEPIDDDIAKKIIERKPFRIRRKGVKDLSAPIPAVHLFGGNNIPKTLDGESRAHDRRWTFVGFSAFVPQGKYDQHYWDFCFEQSPQGVLNFALEGLNDLLESGGHFLNPESGIAKMEEWQMSTDIVGQFLQDIERGEIPDGNSRWERGPGTQIERKLVWPAFVDWHKVSYNFSPRLGKNEFFIKLRAKKIGDKRIRGVDYFSGIGVRESEGGIF